MITFQAIKRHKLINCSVFFLCSLVISTVSATTVYQFLQDDGTVVGSPLNIINQEIGAIGAQITALEGVISNGPTIAALSALDVAGQKTTNLPAAADTAYQFVNKLVSTRAKGQSAAAALGDVETIKDALAVGMDQATIDQIKDMLDEITVALS